MRRRYSVKGKNISGNNFRWKEVVRTLLLVVCGLIIGVSVYSANARTLVGNQLPMPFGYGAAVVLSDSMAPEFQRGDLLIVKEDVSLEMGDIIVYDDVNCLVVHRIVALDEKTITTKGDANPVADEPIEKSAVRAEVLFWIPAVGHIVSFLKTGVGTVLTLIVAVLLVEVPRRRERQKDDEERQRIIDEIKRLKNEV